MVSSQPWIHNAIPNTYFVLSYPFSPHIIPILSSSITIKLPNILSIGSLPSLPRQSFSQCSYWRSPRPCSNPIVHWRCRSLAPIEPLNPSPGCSLQRLGCPHRSLKIDRLLRLPSTSSKTFPSFHTESRDPREDDRLVHSLFISQWGYEVRRTERSVGVSQKARGRCRSVDSVVGFRGVLTVAHCGGHNGWGHGSRRYQPSRSRDGRLGSIASLAKAGRI
ncbi:hypothetical protein B0T09DRAFT_156456 [Sordaria sp. MPI-SDFR-AT-0083]|nr:hypothetical protein B0T09DRAFT_156456 [Sordaria sp. MPI-SDFR-AT-0083]